RRTRSAFSRAARSSSATRSAGARSRIETKSFARRLSSVLAIDPHVLCAEIASPDGGAFGARADTHLNLDAVALENFRGGRRRFVVGETVIEQQDTPNPHGHAGDVERDPCAAGGRNDAPPVRVRAVNGSLDER